MGSTLDDYSIQYAVRKDAEDPLKRLRDEFIIPTKSDIKSKTLKSSRTCARINGGTYNNSS